MAKMGKVTFGTAHSRYTGNGSRLGLNVNAGHLDPIVDTLNGDRLHYAVKVGSGSAAMGTGIGGTATASLHITGSFVDVRFGANLPRVTGVTGVKTDAANRFTGPVVDLTSLATGSLYTILSGSAAGRRAVLCVAGY